MKENFCNFVYSNSGWADPIREKFYKEISKYKRVDSGGAYLNNIGYRVPDKLDFIKIISLLLRSKILWFQDILPKR